MQRGGKQWERKKAVMCKRRATFVDQIGLDGDDLPCPCKLVFGIQAPRGSSGAATTCSIVEIHLGTYIVGTLVVTGSLMLLDRCLRHPNPPPLTPLPPAISLLRVHMRVRVGQVGVLEIILTWCCEVPVQEIKKYSIDETLFLVI
jgi:hypothetical protein